MPEADEIPKVAELITQGGLVPPDRLRKTHISVERQRQFITSEHASLVDKYPARKDLIDTYFLFFKLLEIDEAALKEQRKFTSAEREDSARSQHAFSHMWYLALQKGASPAYVKSVYNLLQATDEFASAESNRDYRQILDGIGGIRHEVAVIQTLKEAGCKVLLPTYSRPKDKLPNEVYDWDIRSGVDLIVITPDGRIILIDVKGPGALNDPKLKEVCGVLVPVNVAKETPALQPYLKGAKSPIFRLVLPVTTGNPRLGMRPLEAETRNIDLKGALDEYVGLNQGAKEYILQSIGLKDAN